MHLPLTVQEKALRHALTLPSLQRLVYSTCSVHQQENEDVVKAVLPEAEELGFKLRHALPSWSRRGLPVFQGAEKLVRTGAILTLLLLKCYHALLIVALRLQMLISMAPMDFLWHASCGAAALLLLQKRMHST